MSDPARTSFKLAEGHSFQQTNGLLHSENDQPAVVYADGTRWWYDGGHVHRDGGPAVIHSNGVEEWWWHNRRHREGGPAVTYPATAAITPTLRGVKQWWTTGQMVREEVPPPVQRYRTMLGEVYTSCFGREV